MKRLMYSSMTEINWRFKIEIRLAIFKPKKGVKKPNEFYYVGVSKANGKDLFQSETQKRKATLKKTIDSLFPYVESIDKTK